MRLDGVFLWPFVVNILLHGTAFLDEVTVVFAADALLDRTSALDEVTFLIADPFLDGAIRIGTVILLFLDVLTVFTKPLLTKTPIWLL